jgi:phosphatidylglycerophosphate synthase
VTRADRLSWDDYAGRWATLHGGIDPRRASIFVHRWLKMAYAVGRACASVGLRPSVITLGALILSAAVPIVAILRGPWLFVAALLVLLSAIADSADGSVAVITSRVSRRGSFYDALADRVGEAAWLLALWLLGAPGSLVVVCGALAWLHEYARARATVSGMAGIGVITVAERPTRVALVIVALTLGGFSWIINPHLTPGTITVVIAVWILLALLGAARLSSAIHAGLGP